MGIEKRGRGNYNVTFLIFFLHMHALSTIIKCSHTFSCFSGFPNRKEKKSSLQLLTQPPFSMESTDIFPIFPRNRQFAHCHQTNYPSSSLYSSAKQVPFQLQYFVFWEHLNIHMDQMACQIADSILRFSKVVTFFGVSRGT